MPRADGVLHHVMQDVCSVYCMQVLRACMVVQHYHVCGVSINQMKEDIMSTDQMSTTQTKTQTHNM